MTQRGQEDEATTMDDRIEDLQRVVGLLVRKLEDDFDCQMEYHPRSVAYLDAILTELQRTGRPLTPSLFLSIGGYVGETLVRTYGGRWTEMEGNLAVEIDGDGHTRTVQVFDWVKQAYADPYEDNLGQRLGTVLGDTFRYGTGDADATA